MPGSMRNTTGTASTRARGSRSSAATADTTGTAYHHLRNHSA
ncbi:hypothetical protein ACR6C2_26595 [Streptomyces sp. INA 01156]